MRLKFKILISMALFAFTSAANAQSGVQADDAKAPVQNDASVSAESASSPVASQVNTIQKRRKIKKEESAWSVTYFSEVGFHRIESKSAHNTEIDINYALTPITVIGLWSGYGGPLNVTENSRPDLYDPQPYLAFEAPLKGSLKQWALTAGIGGIIPASKASREANMIGGASLNGGFKWRSGRWYTQNDNFVYLYRYQPSSDSGQKDQAATEEDDDESTNAGTATEDSPVYMTTEHVLKFGYKFNKHVKWANRWKYVTDTTGVGNPAQKLSLSMSAAISWTPNIDTYGGVATSSNVGDEKAPPLFDNRTVLGFVGLYMSI